MTFRHTFRVLPLALLLAAALASSAQAAPVGLGTADAFSVLGGSTVTNTGPSTLNGDLGVSPGTAITGFPPGTINGAVHANDGVAQQAQADVTTAYNDAAGRGSTATVSADLAGQTLIPGVYTSATSLGLSGDLVLDAQGDASAVFVFQAGSSLTTGSGSRVRLIGGAQACNVFWQVGSSATIGTSTAFTGNILALTSISLTNGATLDGRALARNGAVTLDTNTVTRSSCAATAGTPTGTPGTPTGTPETPAGTATGTPGTPGGTSGAPGTPGATTTARPRPVTSGPASRVVCDEARLNGKVRAATFASRFRFEFGTTKRYGRHTATGQVAASARAVRVHAMVRGLKAGTTYHYRIVGIGPGGRWTYGADRTFQTCQGIVRPSRSPSRPPHKSGGFTG